MTRSAALQLSSLPLLVLGLMGVTACATHGERTGGAQAPADTASHPSTSYAAPGDAPMAPSGSGYAHAEKSAPAPAAAPPSAVRGSESKASAADGGAYEPTPRDERPGLGTEWGETRDSRVSSTRFDRQDDDTPLSTTSFFYNDEGGVRAMLGSNYWDRRTDGISAARGAITIRILDGQGAPLPTFSAGGQSYVMGSDGGRYSIRIDNQTGARFEAVATVDGLDVIDGQPGSFEKRGYLVGPWSSVEIDGFRRSEDQVAAFRFGRVRDSYAAKRGSDRNVGVIGVAVFQERGSSWPWTQRELERRNGADAFPGRFAPPPSR